jgi:membrane protein DedA with SNARE-associated domain
MRSVLPVALFGLAGVLVGGVWSLYRQGASRVAIAVVGLLALLAAVAGVLWLIPGEQ